MKVFSLRTAIGMKYGSNEEYYEEESTLDSEGNTRVSYTEVTVLNKNEYLEKILV